MLDIKPVGLNPNKDSIEAAQVSKNLVVKSIGQGETWTAPAGVQQVQMIARSYGVALSFGEFYGMGIDVSGAMYGWGRNNQGQIADNTTVSKSSPVLVSGPASRLFKFVAAGQTHGLAIGTDGVTYSWGSNLKGELGDNTTASITAMKSSPVAVLGSHSFKLVVAGVNHSAGLDTAGAAWGWGNNSAGEIGDNTNVPKSTPVAVVGGLKFVTLSGNAEGSTVLGITTDGDTYAWGAGGNGRLGNNGNNNVSSPVLVSGSHKFKQVAMGGPFGLAIDANGNLWGWGRNNFGQLGNGNSVDVSTPVQSTSGMKWISISAGTTGGYGITADGKMYAWGRNSSGELGDGTSVDKSSPVLVIGPGRWRASVGGVQGAFGTKLDGTNWGWGANPEGSLGNGTTVTRSSPVQMVGGRTFVPAETTFQAFATVEPGTAYTCSIQTTFASFANAVFPLADIKEILLIYQA